MLPDSKNLVKTQLESFPRDNRRAMFVGGRLESHPGTTRRLYWRTPRSRKAQV